MSGMIMKVSMSIPPKKKRDFLRHEKEKKIPMIMKCAYPKNPTPQF